MSRSQAEKSDRPTPADYELVHRILCTKSLIAYIRIVAPWFTIEEVHCIIAQHMEALAKGTIDRLLISMPPRVGKSQMGSIFLPSWWAGKFPSDKILQVGHSMDLSRGFSRDVREIMRSPEYRWIYPGVRLAKDAQAAGKWRVEETYREMDRLERSLATQRGEYNAAGVTSNIAGKGFHLGVVDDPQSEQDKDSKVVKDRIWNWWGPGFYTRRQPERNGILVIQTRWAKDDLMGHLLAQKEKGGDSWVYLNVPAILDKDSAKRVYTVAAEYGMVDGLQELKEGDSCAPRRWSLKELLRSKANMTTDRDWNALYMGQPNEEDGHILKKKHWRLWPHEKMPECVFVFQMYDTAFTEKTSNDASARTTWGVFEHKDKQSERTSLHMILLDAWKDRIDAPSLKYEVMTACFGGKETKKALLEMFPTEREEIMAIDENRKGYHPDKVLIENKASGIWLIREMRRIKKPRPVPVVPWLPPKGTNGEMGKYARAHYGSLVLEQGAVWYPKREWAEKVINECADCHFDGSDAEDDLPDTVSAALVYVRQTYRVEARTDIDEEEEALAEVTSRQPRRGYGSR